MFCYQCEQTAKGEGCAKSGVCGKLPDVAALQDLLVYVMMGLGQAATAARKAGIRDHEADVFTCEALFATLTNVDFDPARFQTLDPPGGGPARRASGEAPRGGRLRPIFRAGRPRSNRRPILPGLILQGEAVGIRSYPAADPTSSRSSIRSCTGSRGWRPTRTTR